jgi:hypothetical protein
LVSSLLALVDQRRRNPFELDAEPGLSREELVASFVGADLMETSMLVLTLCDSAPGPC